MNAEDEYLSLRRVGYRMGPEAEAEQRELRRPGMPGYVPLGFRVGDHGAWLCHPTIVARRIESIGLKARAVEETLRGLPDEAAQSYRRSLIYSELVATNEIENIHSSRAEIAALDIEEPEGDNPRRDPIHRRFSDFMRLYMRLAWGEMFTPEDGLPGIRAVYDAIASDGVAPEDKPDGELFRNQAEEIVTASQKVIYRPPARETEIVALLKRMLELWADPPTAQLVTACVCHYLFEVAHPFFDGNGRTGRFILVSHLAQILSVDAALAVSSAINEGKKRYYDAFLEVQNPLNRGDLTPFIVVMLGFIEDGVNRMAEDLSEKNKIYSRLRNLVGQTWSDNERRAAEYVVNSHIFGQFKQVRVRDELIDAMGLSWPTVREAIDGLEREGFIRTVKKRPLIVALSDAALAEYRLPEGEDVGDLD